MNARLSLIARLLSLLLIPAMLHGCGDAPSETGPGGVSTDDARQLDEAAAKLDAESQTANGAEKTSAD